MKITTNNPVGTAQFLPKPISEMTREELVEHIERLRGARTMAAESPSRGPGRTPGPPKAKKAPRSLDDLSEDQFG